MHELGINGRKQLAAGERQAKRFPVSKRGRVVIFAEAVRSRGRSSESG